MFVSDGSALFAAAPALWMWPPLRPARWWEKGARARVAWPPARVPFLQREPPLFHTCGSGGGVRSTLHDEGLDWSRLQGVATKHACVGRPLECACPRGVA